MDVKHQIVPASDVSIPCSFAGINVNTPKIIVKIAINLLINKGIINIPKKWINKLGIK